MAECPPPPQVSVDALKRDGADVVYYTQMRGVSNAKAKRTEFSASAVGMDR